MFEAIWNFIKSVNKKVWVTAALLAVIFTTGITWIVVSNAMSAFKPVSWDGLNARDRQTVSGNGGPAVMVGNWLYFVGSYVDSSSIRYRQNEYNKVKEGAIYRVYIDPSVGAPLYENTEKQRANPDYTLHLLDKSKYELVVPKVAGFEQAAIWVFDKYLVYTSPNNGKDKYGELQLSKIDFFRVDLNGKNHRKIYTTTNDSLTSDSFTVTSYNGEVFLLVKDGEMLRRVNVTGKNAGKVSTVSKKVLTVALPIVTSYHRDYSQNLEGKWEYEGSYDVLESYRGIMGYVYYTEEYSEDDQKIGLKGNWLVQYNVRSGDKVEVRIPDHNVDVLALANGRLMYTVKEQSGKGLGLFMTEQAISGANTSPFDIAQKENSTKSFEDFKVLEQHYYQADEAVYLPTVHTPGVTSRFVTLAGSSIYFYEKGNQEPAAMIEGVSKIITITGSTVHYINSAGEVKAADLNNGKNVDGMGGLTPETNISPWVIATRGGAVWHFHIKTLTVESTGDVDSGDQTMVAMLSDLTGGVREFILGRPDCEYVGNGDDCCE